MFDDGLQAPEELTAVHGTGSASMGEDEALDHFEAALRDWAIEAVNYLSRQPNGGLRPLWGQTVWKLDDDGCYRQHYVEDIGYDFHHFEQLSQLDSFRSLQAAAAASNEVKRHLDTIVGNPFARGRLELRSLALAALPPARSASSAIGHLAIESAVHKVMDYIKARDEEALMYSPLSGLSLEGDRLELGPGLSIERMSPEEVARALEYQVILQMMPMPIIQLGDDQAFALKRRYRLPKVIGNANFDDDPILTEAMEDQRRYATEPDELLQCLALITGERVEAPGTLSIQNNRPQGGFGLSLQRRSMGRRFGGGVKLTAEQSVALQRLWQLTHETSFPANKAIALAFRRLASGIQRDRLEDRLIDVFIAAEALYLTDGTGEAKDRVLQPEILNRGI